MKYNEERMRRLITLKRHLTGDTVQWLIDNGFTKAPASTKYNGSYPGGLFDHSMVVLENLLKLTKTQKLVWQRTASPYIVALMHDLCKIDQYVLMSGPEGEHWVWVDTPVTGHGAKSLIYARQLMFLTEEEQACIRWHMGAFGDKEEQQGYSDAVKQFQNVLWTHTADMVASQVSGI